LKDAAEGLTIPAFPDEDDSWHGGSIPKTEKDASPMGSLLSGPTLVTGCLPEVLPPVAMPIGVKALGQWSLGSRC